MPVQYAGQCVTLLGGGSPATSTMQQTGRLADTCIRWIQYSEHAAPPRQPRQGTYRSTYSTVVGGGGGARGVRRAAGASGFLRTTPSYVHPAAPLASQSRGYVRSHTESCHVGLKKPRTADRHERRGPLGAAIGPAMQAVAGDGGRASTQYVLITTTSSTYIQYKHSRLCVHKYVHSN